MIPNGEAIVSTQKWNIPLREWTTAGLASPLRTEPARITAKLVVTRQERFYRASGEDISAQAYRIGSNYRKSLLRYRLKGIEEWTSTAAGAGKEAHAG